MQHHRSFEQLHNLQNMSLSTALEARSEKKCELCNATHDMTAYQVPPKSEDNPDYQVAVCSTCFEQLNEPSKMDATHWRCLNESIWSQVPAVQVTCYRALKNLASHPWSHDLIGSIYMDDETLEWAEYGTDAALVHKDSNGHILEAGDTVTLIQDLNVKGATFTAKRGTAVRRIRLVHDNAEHIEGKIEGQSIVILTKFVKKSN